MGDIQRDRRTRSGEFRGRPPSSPVNVLIMTVTGVLLATAAATVLMGGGVEDTTPHGQLLSSLARVADAQETHYTREGSFSLWADRLELEREANRDLDVTILWADATGWEAMAIHPMGLSCMQRGVVRSGKPQREQPVCYIDS